MHDLFKVIGLILKISIILQVFATGLGATWSESTYLFRRPGLLFNSILARNVAAPLVAVLLIKGLSLRPEVAIALGVLAVTPVPPLLPKSQLQVGGRSEYVLGLLVSQAVLSIALVPLTIEAMDWAFDRQDRFSAGQVAAIVFQSILIPLALGWLASKIAPKLRNYAAQLNLAGTVLLVIGLLPLFYLAWKALIALAGNATLLAMAIFVLAGTVAGHLLGGPRTGDRAALAIATSARHPAIAIAVIQANFPEQTALAAGAVILYFLLRLVLIIPYTKWMRKHAPPPTVRLATSH
jgi:BASS family bile acid:Na+ symporter